MDVSKLFSTTSLHAKEVSACGETFTVHVKRLPAVDLLRFQHEVVSPDRDERITAGFKVLVKSIRNEDGSAFATFDQYKKMDREAIGELMRVFTEVNGKEIPADLGNA
jgi:hypothetical protein